MDSSRDHSKSYLATFVERKTRFYIAVPMETRTKESMFNAISPLHKTLTTKLIKIIALDRGKEFACYPKVEKDFKIPVYFAAAYAT